MKIKTILRFFHWWPPFWGTGIRVDNFSEDLMKLTVSMRLTWYNKNYVGTQFGGSLYAMTDPFYMLMLIPNIGKEYIVWDKAAHIEYVKAGRSKVHANFEFTPKEIQNIKNQVRINKKFVFDKPLDILDESGDIVAKITKTLYVRAK